MRLHNSDKVKTVMMLLIILYHSMALWLREQWFIEAPVHPNALITFTAEWFNTFHIYVFTFVSGYLFYYLRFEKGKYQTYVGFLKNKAERLIVPFVFVSLIWCIPIYVLLHGFDGATLFKAYALGYSPEQLWYVVMLFVLFALVYPIAPHVVRMKSSIWWGVIVAVYFVGVVIGEVINPPYQISNALRHMAFFMIGMYFCKEKTEIKVPWWILACVSLAVFSGVYFSYPNKGILAKAMRVAISPFLSFIGVLLVIKLIEDCRDSRIWKTKAYAFFKDQSFTMYLFHQQIVYGVLLLLNGEVSSWILVIINFIVSLLISGAMSVLLNRFSVTRYLVGYRK